MKPLLRVNATALLFLSLLIFLAEEQLLAALLPAVVLHEAGHLLALRLLGRRVRGMALELTGLRIDYAGAQDERGEILAAAAGPAAGLLWAWGASRLGTALQNGTLLLSAGLSLLLSLFNLLPAPPLDGGRIAAGLLALWPGGEWGERLARLLGLLTGLFLTLAGCWLLWHKGGAAVLLAGGMLLAEQRTKRLKL